MFTEKYLCLSHNEVLQVATSKALQKNNSDFVDSYSAPVLRKLTTGPTS